MHVSCVRCASVALGILLCIPSLALAQSGQTPPHVPMQKAIGQTSKAQVYPSLIVFNSRGATIQSGKLTLTGIAPVSIVFADRPHRAAGHDLTSRLLEEWSPSNQARKYIKTDTETLDMILTGTCRMLSSSF